MKGGTLTGESRERPTCSLTSSLSSTKTWELFFFFFLIPLFFLIPPPKFQLERLVRAFYGFQLRKWFLHGNNLKHNEG